MQSILDKIDSRFKDKLLGRESYSVISIIKDIIKSETVGMKQGILKRVESGWVVRYKDKADPTPWIEVELHPASALYCLSGDDGRHVQFSIKIDCVKDCQGDCGMCTGGKEYAVLLKEEVVDDGERMIDLLIDFQLYLEEKGLITNHDWDFEKLAKQFTKKNKKR